MSENTPGQNKGSQRNDDALQSGADSATNSNSTHLADDQGGTADMGSQGFQEATGTSRRNTGGDEASTKKSVTGSDFDGQVG